MPVSVEKDFRVKNGLQVVSTLTVLSTTAAFSTQTGALQVKGGAAVAGGMVVGGTLTATTFVGNFSGTITGNAASADKWSSARTINLGGDLSGSVSIDGTQNVTLTATIAADSVQLGTDTQGNYVATAFTNGYGLSGLSSQEGGIFTVTSNATSTNLPSTIVFRDANSNFNANIITANTVNANLSGTASTATLAVTANAWTSARTITLGGDLSGSVSINGSQDVTLTATIAADSIVLGTDTTGSYIATGATSGFGISGSSSGEGGTFTVTSNATSTNAVSTIVYRDVNGNFNATSAVFEGTTNSITTNSGGALRVTGGVGVGGNVIVGGYISATTSSYINNALIITTATLNQYVAQTTILAGTDTAVLSSNNQTTIWNTSTLQTISSRGSSTDQSINITNATASTSTSTGALRVTGGVGLGGALYAGATSYVGGSQIITTATIASFIPSNVSSITAGTDTVVSAASGAVTIWNNSTLQSVTGRGATTNNAVSITNSTAATSTQTGALQVTGGVGVGGNLYVGGEIVAQKLTIQLTTITTTLIETDDIIKTNNTTDASSTTTGALQITGGAGIGGNLYVGGTVFGTVNSATKWSSSRTLTLDGDLAGSVTFDGSGNFTLTTVIQADSVSLGIDTIGNYVATGQTSGYGISGSTSAESAIFTVTSNATSSNAVSTIVYRDGNGNFVANKVTLQSTLDSIFTTSNAVDVVGSVGMGGNLNVGGTARISTTSYINNSIIITAANIGTYADLTVITAGTDTAVSSSTGALTIWNNSTLQTITSRGASTNNAITINNASTSFTTGSGALVVQGGVGIGQALYVNTTSFIAGAQILTSATVNQFVTPGITTGTTGTFVILNTTSSTSTSTGALQVRGGVGIGGDLYVQNKIFAGLAQDTVNNTVGVFYNPATKELTTSTAASGSSTGTTSTFLVNNTTTSTSTSTGALQVRGGAGIAGDLYVGGTINGLATRASNINNGLPGEIPYQSTTSTTQFISTGSTGSVLVSNGTLAPTWQNTLTLTSVTSATSTITGALQVRGGVGIGGSLYAQNIFSNGNQVLGTSIQEFICTAGQTTFTFAGGYTVGLVQVFANGVQLSSSDYTASNGSTVVVTIARRLNDIIRIIGAQGFAANATQAYTFSEVIASSNGQTVYTASYNTNTVQVFVDGVLRSPTAYTASNGTSITLQSGSGIVVGTRIGVLSFNSISLVGAISQSGGTINGVLNVNGSLRQNGTDVAGLSIAMSVAMGI